MIGKKIPRRATPAGDQTITWQLVRGVASWLNPGSWTSPIIGWLGDEFYSHIDVVTPKGMLRGARSDWIGNVPPGYQDRVQHYERWAKCTRFTLAVSSEAWAKYWEFSDQHVGSPYDERGVIAAFVLGRKHKLRDKRDKWVGWCSQEVALNGEAAGLWKIPPDVPNVDPGDCAFLFAGLGALRQEMPV